MPKKIQKISKKSTRPQELDPRVFFCEDFIGSKKLHLNNLLWLLIHKEESTTFPWSLEFDILGSGLMIGSVAFSPDQYQHIVQLFESKPFNWKNRQTGSGNSIIWYKYKKLSDVIEVANSIAEFTYQLHRDPSHQQKVSQLYSNSYKSSCQKAFCCTYIRRQHSGQYSLTSPENIDFVIFENRKISTKSTLDSFTSKIFYGYDIKRKIKLLNPTLKDGVLIVNHNKKRADFYSMSWKEICLILDGAKITKDGNFYKNLCSYPHVWSYSEQLLQEFYPESLDLEVSGIDDLENMHETRSHSISEKNVVKRKFNQRLVSFNSPDLEIQEDIATSNIFLEGRSSKIIINSYERNPKARKKCIEHYGDSCFTCGFNFGDVFGELGKGFIHVHHLTPISEISEEYEVDPIQDMRPLCPNCHAMIHRREPLLSVEELRLILNKNLRK